MKKEIFDSMWDDDKMEEVYNALKNYNIPTDLIAICQLNRWDGHQFALVNLSKHNNTKSLEYITKSMLEDHSFINVELNFDGDVTMSEAHHDATNYYVFKKMKKRCNFEILRHAVIRYLKENPNATLQELCDYCSTRTTPISVDVTKALYAVQL